MIGRIVAGFGAVALSAGLHAHAATVVRNADFLASLGVNTHLNYTDGTYANYRKVIEDLAYLGIRRLRDNAPNPKGGIPYRNYVTALHAAAAAGNKFDFVTSAAQPIQITLEQIDIIAQANPGSVIAVEGPTGVNNTPVIYKGLTGDTAAIAYQKDLYAAVHADRHLQKVAVYYYTGHDVASTIVNLADYANTHPYPYRGVQPSARLDSDFSALYTMAAPYRKVITETGYFNVPTAESGVDDATQAKNTLNLYLDAYSQGVSLTYVYQLLSAYPNDDSDTQYGLFRIDHSPKPVATAIHNLTTILADPGDTDPQPGKLGFSVVDLPSSGRSLLLQNSAGIFYLIVWAEPKNWDDGMHRPIKVTPTTVTVRLGATYKAVAIYDPTERAAPVRTFSNTDTVQIGVTDHPLIVEISAGHR